MEDETRTPGTPEEAGQEPEAQVAEEVSEDDQASSEEASSESQDELSSEDSPSESAEEDSLDEGGQDDAVVNPEDASEEDAEAAMMAMLEESEQSEDGASGMVHNPDDSSEEDAEAAMMAMLQDLPSEEQKASADDINFGSSVSSAEFQQLQQPAGKGETRNIELLLDVNLPISIELGRTKMAISDILALGPGSVVELNKLAGEPVDLLVNGRIVARGEVVVVDENFGVRITQLLTTEERLKVLGDQS